MKKTHGWLSILFILALLALGDFGLLAESDCLTVSPETQLPSNAACRGPFAVAHAEYNSLQTNPEGIAIEGVDGPVDIWGIVSYPEGFPSGPAPLILILHGNQGADGCQTPSTAQCRPHEGFRYLIDHLASHGFIAVSINANRINGGDFDRIQDRGYLMLDHLKRWAIWSKQSVAPFEDLFVGRVDMSHIGLMGHSRGGEAVVAAYNLNRRRTSSFDIKAVFSIAPTDKQGLTVQDVAYYALVPACDGDVLDYDGVRFFDRSLRVEERQPTSKQVGFAIGANHNHFNTLWGTDGGGCFGIDLLKRNEQETLAKTLGTAFFRRFLLNEPGLHYVFTGDVMGPSTPDVPIWISYADPRRLEIDAFDRSNDDVNRLGGVITAKNFEHLSRCGPDFEQACSAAFVNEVSVLAVRWINADAVYETKIPSTFQDVSAYAYLSLRVAQNPNDILIDGLNLQGNPLHFNIRLTDTQGNVAQVSTQSFGGVPFPIGATLRDPQSGKSLRRTVLKTLRIPLDRFDSVDLTHVAQIALAFNDSEKGSLYIGDIQFSQ